MYNGNTKKNGGSTDEQLSPLQKDYADLLIKFFKILKEIKLDFNVGVLITGIENLYRKEDMTKMDSFIYILRTCSLYFP